MKKSAIFEPRDLQSANLGVRFLDASFIRSLRGYFDTILRAFFPQQIHRPNDFIFGIPFDDLLPKFIQSPLWFLLCLHDRRTGDTQFACNFRSCLAGFGAGFFRKGDKL